MQKAGFFTLELGNNGLPKRRFFAIIIFDGDDIIDDLINNKVLVNVDAMEITEFVGGAGNFVEDAKEEKTITISSYAWCINARCVK
jgi:hypothetical protein